METRGRSPTLEVTSSRPISLRWKLRQSFDNERTGAAPACPTQPRLGALIQKTTTRIGVCPARYQDEPSNSAIFCWLFQHIGANPEQTCFALLANWLLETEGEGASC